MGNPTLGTKRPYESEVDTDAAVLGSQGLHTQRGAEQPALCLRRTAMVCGLHTRTKHRLVGTLHAVDLEGPGQQPIEWDGTPGYQPSDASVRICAGCMLQGLPLFDPGCGSVEMISEDARDNESWKPASKPVGPGHQMAKG